MFRISQRHKSKRGLETELDLQPKEYVFHLINTTMEYEELRKSLWHAFDVLDTSSHSQKIRTSQVQKTKLRVLTNNLGSLLGVDKAETIWDKVSDDSISFDEFMKVLSNNLLVGFDKNSETRLASLKADIDNLCWILCEKSYRRKINSTKALENENGGENSEGNEGDEKESENSNSVMELSSADTFRLWKIFNFLVERAEDGTILYPLRTDIEEAERIAVEICQAVGLPAPKIDFSERRGSLDAKDASFLLDFSQFVKLISQKLNCDDDELSTIGHGITEVYNQIVSDVVRKGYMIKFGNKVTAWKERWFVLTATSLKYYVSYEEKDLKGTVTLCSQCFTQSFPDKPGGKHHRFKLHTPSKQYELSAPDLKSKNEWMSALKRVVISIGKSKESLQKQAWKERKKEREERRRRTAEEEMNRIAEREKLLDRERQLEEERKQRQLAQEEIKERERLLELERKKRAEEEEKRRQETNQLLEEKKNEIEAEKQRCADTEARLQAEREALMISSQEALEAEREQRAQVEARLRQEEAELEEERRRLKELEEEKASLEALVEHERALKRDEEIVRNLQSKILEEEFAKREELERLQAEQNQQLEKEKMSRQELEEAHRQQEEALRLAKERLDALAEERLQAEQQLEEAAEKLKLAEKERHKMEERMKLKEMNSASRLARALPTPDPDPFVTHRGKGAFTEADFKKKTDVNGVPLQHDTETSSNENTGVAEEILCDGTDALNLDNDIAN